MRSKQTSFDIAYRAGVSQSTVSRALRNSPLVNEETRIRVQAIAKELNYKVDKNASSLRTQLSGTIALLLFEDPTNDDSLINPFFLSMLGSITRASAKKGYDLLVSFQQMSNDWHADFEDTRKADGIILLGYGDYTDYEEKLVQLIKQETHFVRWGADVKGLSVVSVGCDNFHGGYQVTEHVIKQNRQHFAFLGG
ncbi:MAG: alanine racemase, partial [Cognaticolwellia sp.]